MERLVVLMTLLRVATLEEAMNYSTGGTRSMLGFRVNRYDSIFPYTLSSDMMIPELADGTEVTLRIIGHLANVAEVALTSSPTHCKSIIADTITSIEKESSSEVGSIVFMTPSHFSRKETFYFCFRSIDGGPWKHQGSGYWAMLIVVRHFLSMIIIIASIAACILIAAVLNASLLGLLSLKISELRTKSDTCSGKHKWICRALLRLRSKGNLILATFIPGIVFFKTAVAVLLNLVVSGWVSIIVSSLLVCLLCEVAPRLRRRTLKREDSTMPTRESSFLSKPKEEDDPSH